MIKLAGILLACFVAVGCESHFHNRGGATDAALDAIWWKADSKKMRALRAYGIQAALVRIGSSSRATVPERNLMVGRVVNASDRFDRVLGCAFRPTPCPIYDSYMSDYETALYELALTVFDTRDRQLMFGRLESFLGIGAGGPVNVVHMLAQLGREALRTGRVVGALYRDAVELEVVAWIKTPATPGSPIAMLIGELSAEHATGADSMERWEALLARLRTLGQPAIGLDAFKDIHQLIAISCGMLTGDPKPKAACESPPSALGPVL